MCLLQLHHFWMLGPDVSRHVSNWHDCRFPISEGLSLGFSRWLWMLSTSCIDECPGVHWRAIAFSFAPCLQYILPIEHYMLFCQGNSVQLSWRCLISFIKKTTRYICMRTRYDILQIKTNNSLGSAFWFPVLFSSPVSILSVWWGGGITKVLSSSTFSIIQTIIVSRQTCGLTVNKNFWG